MVALYDKFIIFQILTRIILLMILNHWFLAFLLLFLNERKYPAGNDYPHSSSQIAIRQLFHFWS